MSEIEQEFQLELVKHDPDDPIPGIVRVGPDTILALKIPLKGVVEIEGNEVTVARVYGLDRDDWIPGIIQGDDYIKENADVQYGEEVKIRKPQIDQADKVTLEIDENSRLNLGSRSSELLKRQLLGRPVLQGDLVPLMSSSDDPLNHSTIGSLTVLETEPKGKVVVNQDTELIFVGHTSLNIGSGIPTKDYDAFICHASEDKKDIVEPLANSLADLGLDIWYDDFELEIGDSLGESIDEGLANSRYGIVILSENFFNKDWAQYEYRGLLQKDMGEGKVILPLRYEISFDEIIEYSPPLADKYIEQIDPQAVEETANDLYKIIMGTDAIE